jgi:pimeloyl-ACP methyl ester carboxylesterase
VFGPAAAANYRSNLLRTGNLSDRVLRRIDTPTLLLSSAKDRMLPSLAEGAQPQLSLCPCKQTVRVGLPHLQIPLSFVVCKLSIVEPEQSGQQGNATAV